MCLKTHIHGHTLQKVPNKALSHSHTDTQTHTHLVLLGLALGRDRGGGGGGNTFFPPSLEKVLGIRVLLTFPPPSKSQRPSIFTRAL
jgi:hypothetical protein